MNTSHTAPARNRGLSRAAIVGFTALAILTGGLPAHAQTGDDTAATPAAIAPATTPSPSPSETAAPTPAPAPPAWIALGKASLDLMAQNMKLVPVNNYNTRLPGEGMVRTYKPAAGGTKRVAIYWTAKTGAAPVELTHPVGQAYRAAKYEAGKYGYPVAPAVAGTNYSVSQKFQGGTISYEPSFVTAGRKAIDAKAKSLKLIPVNSLNMRLAGEGGVQTFKPSATSTKQIAIWWTAKTGARAVDLSGSIGKQFKASAYERGALGYPTSDMVSASGGYYQHFQKGTVTYASGAGTQIMTGPILNSWKSRGPAAVGYPMQSAKVKDGITTQVFTKGSLVGATTGATFYTKNDCWALGAGKTRYNPGNARRVSLTIAERYGTYEADFTNCVRVGSIYKQEWKTGTATVGLPGFKKPGVPSGHTQYRWSPQGMYSVTEAFGAGNPGTKLKYQKLNNRSRWSGTLGSSYNKYYTAPSASYEKWPDENMWRYMNGNGTDYWQGAVINYNRGPGVPIRQGEGFAIFLHADPKPTFGCIALNLGDVTKYLKTAAPGDQIIMGVRADVFKK